MRSIACALLVCCYSVTFANEVFRIETSKPYTGSVSAEVHRSGESHGAKKETGTATAQFSALDERRTRLEVQANIRRKNDSGFVIDGDWQGSRWVGRSKTLTIIIDRDGAISGGGIENQHRIAFGGTASVERMDLIVTTERQANATGNDSSVATRIVFDYDLMRDASVLAETDAKPPSDGPERECKRIIWKSRNVTTPGGGMQMIQVPHCVN